ncbi:hypothetical protein NQ318_006299 [Aromia moschata]|uniref:Uncharacterized protein n=1 Tax=Aromia moschata TaxID=1265417 RepID=A0AAV8YWW5_9CUCU|nr:hypothetical protein NQ318_006299 [Aromia moschata]
MGGAPSKTRKLTVENDDPTSVIKVSEGVVDRIRGNQMQLCIHTLDPLLLRRFFFNEPSLTSLQMRQANIAELKKNDDYWENRIRNLEANHKKINEIIDEEQKKAVEEVMGTKKSTAVLIQPPCQDTKKAVLECYRHYPNEPMRCAKVVQAFQECVDLKRSCLVANRG